MNNINFADTAAFKRTGAELWAQAHGIDLFYTRHAVAYTLALAKALQTPRAVNRYNAALAQYAAECAAVGLLWDCENKPCDVVEW